MKDIYKKILLILAVVLVIFALSITINLCAKQYARTYLSENIPENIKATYADLQINIFSGTVILHEVDLQVKNKADDVFFTDATVKEVAVKGISYWSLLVNKKIVISEIALETPNGNYYPFKKKSLLIAPARPMKVV